MNWEKKTIESYKSELNKGGCFTSLWCVIANSYQFYKIPINISDEKYVQIKLKIKYSSNEMNINFDEDILNQIPLCTIIHNRDKNAVQNMLYIVDHIKKTGSRPEKYTRKESETNSSPCKT